MVSTRMKVHFCPSFPFLTTPIIFLITFACKTLVTLGNVKKASGTGLATGSCWLAGDQMECMILSISLLMNGRILIGLVRVLTP